MPSIQKTIGPKFVSEVEASDCMGLPFSWGPDSIDWVDGALTDEQVKALTALVDAHDPAKLLPATISAAAVIDLFSPAEQAAILTSADIGVKLWLTKAMAATEINLGATKFSDALDYLISKSILTDKRKTQIISNTPPAP